MTASAWLRSGSAGQLTIAAAQPVKDELVTLVYSVRSGGTISPTIVTARGFGTRISARQRVCF
jgi:hypothetical protein